MDRALLGTAFTAQMTLFQGSVASDPTPDSATIEVRDSLGATVQAAGTAANNAGTGVFTYTLSPTLTALLDVLEIRWTFSANGVAQSVSTWVEVVGGFLCSLGDIATVVSGTDAQLAAARTAAELRLEDACGMAFVPRYTLERRRASRGGVRLARTNVRAIRTLAVDGVALSDAARGLLQSTPYGLIGGPWGFTGYRTPELLVGYEHGLDYPGPDVRQAVIAVASETARLATSSGRVVSESADNVSVTYANIDTASGSAFVNPELIAFVRSYRPTLVA